MMYVLFWWIAGVQIISNIKGMIVSRIEESYIVDYSACFLNCCDYANCNMISKLHS